MTLTWYLDDGAATPATITNAQLDAWWALAQLLAPLNPLAFLRDRITADVTSRDHRNMALHLNVSAYDAADPARVHPDEFYWGEHDGRIH